MKRIGTSSLVLLLIGFPAVSLCQDTVTGSGSTTISVSNMSPQVSEYIGIPSSAGTTAACTSGLMMIGVGGTKLKFIQKITPICGTYSKTGTTLSEAPLDASAIGLGASGFKLNCPAGQVVTKLRVAYQENVEVYPYLGGVEISCAPWFGWRWSSSPILTAGTTGFDSWQKKPSVSCASQNQPVRSLRVRRTTSVKALSIICDEP